jgi:hypothetical protein
MSSITTRTEIKNFFTANSSEKLVDISGEFRNFLALLQAEVITRNDDWVAIQFVGSTEEPISIQTKCYREFGTIFFHVVAPIQIGGIDDILIRCETIRDLYKGQRINDIVIEAVGPPNTEVGTTLEFENTFTSATFIIDYYRDIKG